MGSDGKVIISFLADAVAADDGISSQTNGNKDLYRFFGTVKSLSADRATVLLTDGKTTCDVPTYYNDGELKEGMDVMLVLDADASLFGSGESFKDDYAVFYTEPKEYLLKKYDDISKLVYAKLDANNANKYVVTLGPIAYGIILQFC